MERIFNFSAGPSMLPLEIIEQAAAETYQLPRMWYVGNGDEPPLAGVPGHHRHCCKQTSEIL